MRAITRLLALAILATDGAIAEEPAAFRLSLQPPTGNEFVLGGEVRGVGGLLETTKEADARWAKQRAARLESLARFVGTWRLLFVSADVHLTIKKLDDTFVLTCGSESMVAIPCDWRLQVKVLCPGSP